MNNTLYELAEFIGIQTTYQNAGGTTVETKEPIILQLLNELGINIKTPDEASRILHQLKKKKKEQVLEPVLVFHEKRKAHFYISNQKELIKSVTCCSEAGKIINLDFVENKINLPALEYGYYRVELIFCSQKIYQALLLIKPKQFYDDKRTHTAVFTPLYSIHSEKTIGCGDITALEQFARWLQKYQVDVIATLPFFAAFYDKESTPGPYSPLSRLFWNELYLDIT